MNALNGYSLSRQWHDFAFENPDKATTTHAAIIFWLIELNNRLGWKPKFGVPTVHSMEATNIKSYKTYKKCFDDLIEWGFINLVQKATNNHTSNVIELVIFTESTTNSLSNSITNSLPTQLPNEVQVNYQLSVDIDKPKTFKPKREKISPHLFSESIFADFEKFSDEFKETEWKSADLKYYFDSFMDWSKSGNKKKTDWIATVRNGMRKDKKEGKFKQQADQPLERPKRLQLL